MSFLDATGLGTFWAKLKNYFVPAANTVAPVTGLTDILTPENLYDNSKAILFSFTHLIENPKTFTITDATSPISDNGYIADGISLVRAGITSASITVSFSNEVITISGTINGFAATGDRWLAITNSWSHLDTKFYTESAQLVSNSSTEYCKLQMSVNTSTSTIVNNLAINNDEKTVRILKPSAITTPRTMIIFESNTPNNFEFSVSYKNQCIYEGKFLNPEYRTSYRPINFPPISSLQACLGAIFKQVSFAKNQIGWHRFYKFIKMDTTAGPYTLIKLQMTKGFGTSLYEKHIITAAINVNSNKGYIDDQAFKGTGTFALSKFRIIKSSDNQFYLEGYYTQNNIDTFAITLKEVIDNKDMSQMILSFTSGYVTQTQYWSRYYESLYSFDTIEVIPENAGTVFKEITVVDKLV